MQITLSGHGIEITDSLRDYVHLKIGKLEEFYKNIQKAEVVLDAKAINDLQQSQVAEIRVWMGGLKMIQAKEGGKDMYAAFDLAFQEAKRQVEKHKEKTIDERRRTGSKEKLKRQGFESPSTES